MEICCRIAHCHGCGSCTRATYQHLLPYLARYLLHPSPYPLSPLPAPSARLSHMCVLVAILMCQVFYLRVLPTLILFAHLPGKSGRKPANFMQKRSGGGGKSGVECAARRPQRRGCIAVPSRLAFMFNSCANCRGNLASSVLNAVRCF